MNDASEDEIVDESSRKAEVEQHYSHGSDEIMHDSSDHCSIPESVSLPMSTGVWNGGITSEFLVSIPICTGPH